MKRWKTRHLYRIALFLITLATTLSAKNFLPLAGPDIAAYFCRSFWTFFSFLPPVFILLGLFECWVPRDKVVAHLGHQAGLKGLLIALFLGAAAAGPLYLAFPVAEVLRQKGAGVFQVMVFIGAWSTLKIPMFLFEVANLGTSFALTRYAFSLFGIMIIAKILTSFVERSGTSSPF